MADSSGGNTEPNWRALVAPAQQGDRDARTSLYEVFASTVHAIALAHVGRDYVDDVTQDVFCTVFASLPRMREPDAFAGFLCTAARNAARDHLRRKKCTPVNVSSDELVDSARSPVATMAAEETASRVMSALHALPDTYRETLLLRLVSGLSGTEIAERTGMTHGSVRVNLTRGMGLLRDGLAGLISEVMP
ncbi:MAG: RNA polymerase sigma-70 factor (ECF subfamily) [Planctomycetota bacterium]|jgi:RNA polymerase sigma-70 factor (ECF subfamily)